MLVEKAHTHYRERFRDIKYPKLNLLLNGKVFKQALGAELLKRYDGKQVLTKINHHPHHKYIVGPVIRDLKLRLTPDAVYEKPRNDLTYGELKKRSDCSLLRYVLSSISLHHHHYLTCS